MVIGAGLSGLTAARRLHQAGYRVRIVDKSRGLGGRLATRRLGSTAIDHGCRYLQPFGEDVQSTIPALLEAGVLRPWQPETFTLAADNSISPRAVGTLYAAPQGMSAIAKALAPGLTIHRQWRATALTTVPQGWRIEGESLAADTPAEPEVFSARAVVVAIPAPQAADLMAAAAQQNEAVKTLVQQIQTVEFEAVMTVMAGYGSRISGRLPMQTATGGWMILAETHPTLRWIGLDSSKRTDPEETVVVLHSSAAFADRVIDRPDLDTIGQELLATAAALGAWLKTPDWIQVHRWRYGFVRLPLGTAVLRSPVLPHLVGCGDWCSGGNAEGAIASGNHAADHMVRTLERPSPETALI